MRSSTTAGLIMAPISNVTAEMGRTAPVIVLAVETVMTAVIAVIAVIVTTGAMIAARVMDVAVISAAVRSGVTTIVCGSAAKSRFLGWRSAPPQFNNYRAPL
ncbi:MULTISPECIES: hypothetical protein [unclassified Sphingomonas]|uniref:hypothetical protein n=1 Tax=unclassified Sphingomonas TaxID=196159 RepID=UPI00226A1B90|nr:MULTISPECIES: hypothetical protein [unclassified Sphingomonas]